jgi:WASH complex subunit 7
VNVTSNALFREEFGLNIRNMLATLEPRLGEANERDHRDNYVGLCGLVVLHYNLYNVIDKKVVKVIELD